MTAVFAVALILGLVVFRGYGWMAAAFVVTGLTIVGGLGVRAIVDDSYAARWREWD